MNTAPAIKRVALVDAFTLRAEARALLWSVGELELHEAVDVLQHDAQRDGLVELVGADAVQQVIARAFEVGAQGPPI